MNFVEMLQEKDTLTTNGAITNSTSHNYNLDLFFLAGACRNESVENIEKILLKSYNFDRLKTLKIIFWAGDIRQGAGERRFFKIALNWLNKRYPDDISLNMTNVPEFSRWDVLFDIIDNKDVMEYIISEFKNGNSLLCKWLPRKTTTWDKYSNTVYKVNYKGTVENKSDLPSNSMKKDVYEVSSEGKKYIWTGQVWTTFKEEKVNDKTVFTYNSKVKRTVKNGVALKIRKALGLTEKEYRKMLVENTKVVEQQMCAKEWDKIEYSHVPSVAMNKYNKAWYRNDKERFSKYLEDVKVGKSKINASAIFPHDIVKSSLNGWGWHDVELNEGQITQWNNLPNWLEGKENSIIPVCDVSGSMCGLPICISVGLGLYISERNVGPFKDAFITFSERPQIQVLTGNINDRINQLVESEWGMNTNLYGVFEQILRRAVTNKLDQDKMPKTVLIISDMEFDSCANMTNYDRIKQEYINCGYEIPNIVFWNVNGRAGNVPITTNNKGVALISGASPSIIKSVLTDNINPVNIMNDVIEAERYNVIK